MCSNDVDILAIDDTIRRQFDRDYNEIPIYQDRLNGIIKILENPNLNQRLREVLLTNRDQVIYKIHNLEIKRDYNFYLFETLSIIETYKDILKRPLKLSFIGKPKKSNDEKKNLITRYLAIVRNYYDISCIENKEEEKSSFSISCSNCENNNANLFDIVDNNIYICNICFNQQIVIKYNSSYNDIDRVNIASKYIYIRKVHFRDCINQYQAKQNNTVHTDVYRDLEREFFQHHLLVGDENTPKEVRFSRITKKHIHMFLKELNYSSHYENINLIHYVMTGIKSVDISHLEEQLLDDFNVLTELYSTIKHIKRKSFINSQHVLYQLLRRHKFPCNKDDFIVLKTTDRKCFHDEITKELFESLGWNHEPYF
jgi:Poxvirus Late Transcription Factor VLTF3 like.